MVLSSILILDIHHFDCVPPSGLQVDMACGEHLLDHCQSLKDIKKIAGKEAFQVSATGTLSHQMEES